MKKFLCLFVLTLNLSVFATQSDIMFMYKGKLTSLISAHDQGNTKVLDAFYEIMTVNHGEDVDANKLCLAIVDQKKAVLKVQYISDYLENGIFEEHSLRAETRLEIDFPVILTLKDMSNDYDLASVGVSFCQ